MTLWATPAGRQVKGSAPAASFSVRSVELSTATGWTAVDGSTVRAAGALRPPFVTGSAVAKTSEVPAERPAERLSTAARTTLCANCGDPIVGRKPEAKFCSTCRCERDTINESRRSGEGWARLKADPKRHAERLEHRRVREFDRLIDDPKYRAIVNERQRLNQHRRHVAYQMDRDCERCGLRLGVKYVGRKRRLSNRTLHTWCAKENRRLRQLVFSQIRREARELARRVAA